MGVARAVIIPLEEHDVTQVTISVLSKIWSAFRVSNFTFHVLLYN